MEVQLQQQHKQTIHKTALSVNAEYSVLGDLATPLVGLCDTTKFRCVANHTLQYFSAFG